MTGEGWLPGYIQDYDGQALTLVVPFSDSEFLQTHDVTECSVRVEDGRRINSAAQDLCTASGYCGLDRVRTTRAKGADEIRFSFPM